MAKKTGRQPLEVGEETVMVAVKVTKSFLKELDSNVEELKNLGVDRKATRSGYLRRLLKYRSPNGIAIYREVMKHEHMVKHVVPR